MIIRWQSLTKSLWKNGGGTTTEITRSGGDAFEWRASVAEIASDGPFSEFAGYERALVVIEGEGLRLGSSRLLPLKPFYFSGERSLDCQLIRGPVRDFGVIYKRGFTCSVEVVTNPSTTGTLLFVLEGNLFADSERLEKYDACSDAAISGEGVAIRVTLQRSIV